MILSYILYSWFLNFPVSILSLSYFCSEAPWRISIFFQLFNKFSMRIISMKKVFNRPLSPSKLVWEHRLGFSKFFWVKFHSLFFLCGLAPICSGYCLSVCVCVGHAVTWLLWQLEVQVRNRPNVFFFIILARLAGGGARSALPTPGGGGGPEGPPTTASLIAPYLFRLLRLSAKLNSLLPRFLSVCVCVCV